MIVEGENDSLLRNVKENASLGSFKDQNSKDPNQNV